MSQPPLVRLADCCEIVSGATPNTSVKGYWGGDIAWATPKDLSEIESKLLSSTAQTLSLEGYESCSTRLMPPGSVLFSSRAPIGHVAINTVPMCTNQGFKSFVPDAKRVSPDYLYYWLKANKAYLQSLGNGATFKEVSKATISEVRIPLPPLAEQRRIAAILDKADALRAKRREAIAKLDQLLQSVFLEMFGDPATNCKRLPLATLGDLGEWRSGGTPSRSNPNFFHGHIPWYSSGELNSPYVRISNEYISDAAVAASAAKLMKPGSLMVGMYDTAAFKSSITTIPATCNQAVAFSHLDASKCETVYVYQALQVGKEHFKRLQRGVRQKNLNLSMIRETTIPLPPVGLQRKFATMFAAVLSQIDKQGGQAESMDVFFRAIQRRAFQGTL